MIEASFIRLYAHDFSQFAMRAELGQDVTASVDRRMADARSHATIMDARKGSDHLAALIARLHEEADRFDGRAMLRGTDPQQAAERRRGFLGDIAARLAAPASTQDDERWTDIRRRRPARGG